MIYEDEDLIYFDGVAVQKDKNEFSYGKAYFDKYVGYTGTPIAILLNQHRVTLTEKYCKNAIIDIGIGSGEFIKSSRLKTYGFDINPFGVEWLKNNELYVNPYNYQPTDVEGWTFWDSLEHFTDPSVILNKIPINNYAFITIPIFLDILKVKESKHYRPGEHYWYYTRPGLVKYMEFLGFEVLEYTDAEVKAGREDVLTFVFRRQALPT